MNTVWRDLDPMFKTTLRKYVADSNRLLFDVYAKAVGFNPNHVGLLYLTLKLEQDQFENSHNKKRSYIDMYDSDESSTGSNNNNKNNFKNDKYHQISVYNQTKNNNSKQTERATKRRKINLEPSDNNAQPCIHSIVYRSIQDAEDTHQEPNKSKKSKNVINCSKIPSPLPIYNIYNNANISENYSKLTKRDKDNVELNEYEKLKAKSPQFKNKKLPVSVVQSNKRKIGELLANCDAYKTSLLKKQTSTTRTTRSNT